MLQHCFIIIIRLNNSHLTFMFVKKFLYVVCIEMKVSQNQLENIRLYSHIFEFLLRNSLKVCNLRDNLYKKVAGIYIYIDETLSPDRFILLRFVLLFLIITYDCTRNVIEHRNILNESSNKIRHHIL